jgi:hypothetical protein
MMHNNIALFGNRHLPHLTKIKFLYTANNKIGMAQPKKFKKIPKKLIKKICFHTFKKPMQRVQL